MRWWNVILGVCLLGSGCDAWMKQNVNRVELLNEATKELVATIRKAKDETTARQHLPEIETAADNVRQLWEQIEAARSKNTNTNAAMIVQNKDWRIHQQLIVSLDMQLDRTDPEAREIIEPALEGVRGDGSVGAAF